METQTSRTDLWTQRGNERVEGIERVAWTHTTLCEIASGKLLSSRELSLVLCHDLERRDGGGVLWEGGSRAGDVCVPVADSC